MKNENGVLYAETQRYLETKKKKNTKKGTVSIETRKKKKRAADKTKSIRLEGFDIEEKYDDLPKELLNIESPKK